MFLLKYDKTIMKKTLLLLAAALMLTAVRTLAQSQLWWGYVQDDSYRTALGTGKAETVDQAIFIPGSNPVAVGSAIKAVRFYLRSTSDISNLTLWLSTTLPASASQADVLVQPLDLATLQGGDEDENYFSGLKNEVQLSTPYTVTSAGIYVGYSYTVTSTAASSGQYPIVLSYEDGPDESLFLHTSSIAWQSLAGSYGPLSLKVLLEGQFAQNSVVPAISSEVVTVLGSSSNASVTLRNAGMAGISSIDYTIATGGVTGSEQHLDLPATFSNFGGSTVVQIPFQADAQPGVKQKTLTITKVNGQPNEAATPTATVQVVTLSKTVTRGIAVEEFTGTTCGWCPRGLVGMEKMRKEFGDAFVGIGIHGYTRSTAQDAMYISNYTQVSYGGAPSARINRGEELDPYYGSGRSVLDDFRAALAIPAKAGLSVEGQWNADSTQVVATATIEALIDANYRIEYVLIADGLTGNTQAWRQYNYYHSAYQQFGSADELPDELRFLYTTGEIFNNSYVAYYPVFNDVAIAVARSTQTTAPGQLSAGQTVGNGYTLSMPTNATLSAAIDKKKVFVVALLIDESGKIANAAKAAIGTEGGLSAIHPVTAPALQPAAAPSRYSLDGRRLSAPARGLNIVRQADGTVRKVMVK